MTLAALEIAASPFDEIVGGAPPWLQLGPPQTIDGREVFEVLGDWSDRHEADRPPKYITLRDSEAPAPGAFDKGPDRPWVKQTRPGKPILELKGRHSGKVAILFNGHSMGQHDLWKVYDAGIPIIGMNRTHLGYPTYKGPQPDYLCVVDHCWFDSPHVLAHPGLVNGSTHMGNHGYRVTRHWRMSPFSLDLARDGYAAPVPATTGHLALQLAAYLGFRDIFCLGWDLGGRHFDQTRASNNFPHAIRYHKRQVPVLRQAGINVYVCGSPDSAVTFHPHVPFEGLFA